MCSDPVTLGGGITIAYGGLSLPASARNSPAATHCSYRRCSTCAGEYCAGNDGSGWRCAVVCTVSVTLRVYGRRPTRLRSPVPADEESESRVPAPVRRSGYAAVPAPVVRPVAGVLD